MRIRLGDSFDRFEIAAKWAAPVRRLGTEGVRRGKRVRPTVPDSVAACQRYLVKRHFEVDRPKRLWVANLTYCSTWQGWLYVAFIIVAYAQRIIGGRVCRSMTTDFILDARWLRISTVCTKQS